MARIFSAVYKPTTFDELWKPLAYYNEAYQKESDELQKRMDFNALLETLNTPLDQEAYAEVKKQQDTLKNIAEGMNDPNIGLRAVNQQAMDAFRNQSRMEALAKLYDQRQALIQEQRRANQNGNLLFDVDYTNVPVTELGKYNMNYHTMNPDYIYTTSANFFKQFADLTENGTPEEKRAYGMLRQITGGEYSLGDIQDYINGALPDGEKKDRLNKLVDEFKGRINIEQYNPLNQDGTPKEGNLWTNDAYNTALSAMNAGMYSAASQKKYSYVHLPQSSGSSQPKPESLESLYKKGVTVDPNNPNRKYYFNSNGQLVSAMEFITDEQGNPIGIKTGENGLPEDYSEQNNNNSNLIPSEYIGVYNFRFNTEGMRAKTEISYDDDVFISDIPNTAQKVKLSIGDDGKVSATFPLGNDNSSLYYEQDNKGASEKRTQDINKEVIKALTEINNRIQELNAQPGATYNYRPIDINDIEVYVDKREGRNKGRVYVRIKPNVKVPTAIEEEEGEEGQGLSSDTTRINRNIAGQLK